jgi:hypothetical protein
MVQTFFVKPTISVYFLIFGFRTMFPHYFSTWQVFGYFPAGDGKEGGAGLRLAGTAVIMRRRGSRQGSALFLGWLAARGVQ